MFGVLNITLYVTNMGLKFEISAAADTTTTTTTATNDNMIIIIIIFWQQVMAEDVCFDMFGLQFDVSQNQ
jgi:hypothetical protein